MYGIVVIISKNQEGCYIGCDIVMKCYVVCIGCYVVFVYFEMDVGVSIVVCCNSVVMVCFCQVGVGEICGIVDQVRLVVDDCFQGFF